MGKVYRSGDAKKPVIFLKQHGVDAILTAAKNHESKRVALANEREVALITLGVFTGLRVSELHALNVSDVDLSGRNIHVMKAKGGKRRSIPLNADAAAAVERYLAARGWPADNEPLFVTSRGRMTVRTIQRHVQQLGDAIGAVVEEDGRLYRLSPHKLRHTFVSMLVNSGRPLVVARDLAGHSSTATTEIYAHAHEAREAVDELSRKAPKNEPVDIAAAVAAGVEQALEKLGVRADSSSL